MLRLIFVLIFAAGAGLGIAYPLLMQQASGSEIGRWTVYQRSAGFSSQAVDLVAADAPVSVLVELTAVDRAVASNATTTMTLTATGGGSTALAEVLTFSAGPSRPDAAQAAQVKYVAQAGVIDRPADARYVFTLGEGDVSDIPVQSAELVLRRNVKPVDARAQPVGFSLMAIGFIGLVISLRGRKRTSVEQPARKWGR